MGMVFESLGQPVINGYLVAGAIVGPGGLQLIKELVQVRMMGFGASTAALAVWHSPVALSLLFRNLPGPAVC